MLSSSVYGNPHSKSHSSQRTTKIIENARHQVLKLFNTSVAEYDIIFTQNSTAAVKLVGEGMCSTYGGDWKYVYSEDSHTSLIGLRELANEHHTFISTIDEIAESDVPTLVSWPAQSNFSGARFLDQTWHLQAKSKNANTFTLMDIAALATTHIPDLSNSSSNPLAADFLCLSFYKMFGFPDLGALLVKKGSSASSIFARRKYFGGGTVESLTVCKKFAPRKLPIYSQLEDGTIPFHSIIALSLAIDTHLLLFTSFTKISKHVSSLAKYTYEHLRNLKYNNGNPLCEIYSSSDYADPKKQGPILSFNLKDQNGSWIGYSRFEEATFIEKINIRTGTMCNTGGASRYIGYTEEDIILNHQTGHICGDNLDVLRGKPTGAIRVSLGAMSSVKDVEALIYCLQKYFLNTSSGDYNSEVAHNAKYTTAQVKSLLVYPIKSCGAFSVPKGRKWAVFPAGLQYDREFCVVSTVTGNVLTLKKFSEMANIKPYLDLDSGIMEVVYEGVAFPEKSKCIGVLLSEDEHNSQEKRDVVISRLCGEKIRTTTLNSSEIISFFSDILQVPCTLARSSSNARFYKPHLDGPLDFRLNPELRVEERRIRISMNNSSPLLLISESSVRELNKHRENGATRPIDSAVFRGNIIVDDAKLQPYAEDTWLDISIGKEQGIYSVCPITLST